MSGAFAKETEVRPTAMPYRHEVVQTTPSDAIENEITLYLEVGDAFVELYPHMVHPSVCRQRDFFIPDDTAHVRAGLLLRIENGECLTGRPYFVHNPETHRIWPITEAEALTILQAMRQALIDSASE